MHPRAQWAAFRTFHRLVKAAGRTATGQKMFALGGVQLTYPPGAGHFYRLAACARCGEIIELPEPVLTLSDLELTGQPHLCLTCSRSGIESLAARAARSRPPARPPAGVPAPVDADVAPPEDDLDRAATDVSAIVGPAMFRAEEILTDARQEAAELVAAAQREAEELRTAAVAEHEAAHLEREQAQALMADAEVRAAEVRAVAERLRASAEVELEAAITLSGVPPAPAPASPAPPAPDPASPPLPAPAPAPAQPPPPAPAPGQGDDPPPARPAEEAATDPSAGRSSPGEDGTGDGHEA